MPDDALTGADIDIRVVSVIWSGDNDPEVRFDGCSIYEAMGLLRAALLDLEGALCTCNDMDDFDDEEEDE